MSVQSHSASTASRSNIPIPAPSSARAGSPKKWVALSAVAVAVCVGAGLAWWSFASPPANGSLGPTAVVTRGPMIVSITESGELEADKRRVISNELQWPVVIKQVVAEGTLVRQGETIIQFECKELIDSIVQEKLAVSNARNDYTTAHENLALKKKETDAEVKKAETAVADAKEDQSKYVEGEWPVKESEAKSNIQMAQRDLKLAEEKLNFKLKANAEPDLNTPYSKNEVEAEQLSVDRLDNSLKQSKSELDILIKYTHPRELRRLKTEAEDTELALEKARLQAKTQMFLAQAEDQTKKTVLGMRSDRLKEMLEQESKLVVLAEKDGLVVYDTGGRWYGGGTPVTVQVGEKINSRQQLMIIPDMSTLQVKTRVYEAMVDQILPGLEAAIRLDAKPGLPLTGKVSRVSVLPDSQNRWLSPDIKIFNVIVQMDERPEGLKPGMTAQVEMVLSRLDDVLSVPVAAIFTEQESTFCWKLAGGRAEPAPVKIGRTNDKRAELVEGLQAGDKVLLSPPPGVAASSQPGGGKLAIRSGTSRPASSRATQTRPVALGDPDQPDEPPGERRGRRGGSRLPRPAGGGEDLPGAGAASAPADEADTQPASAPAPTELKVLRIRTNPPVGARPPGRTGGQEESAP